MCEVLVRKKRKNIPEDSLVHYRQAEAIAPDPLRKLTTWLIAAGIIVSALVLADAIEYIVRVQARETPPVVLGIVDLDGLVKDKDRGEQKIKPDVEEPEKNEQEEPEKNEPERAVDAPRDPTEPVDDPAPVAGDKEHERAPAIANRGSGPPSRAITGPRRGAAKKGALAKFGGTAQTERAVNHGLDWLARHQDADGKWNRIEFGKNCKPGQGCGGAGYHRRGYEPVPLDPAMTGLALLCFAASNNTHLEGKYKANVAAGIGYLQRIQAKNGRFGTFRRGVDQYMMYNQGIATFALGEICAMTGDQTLKPAIENAIRFIVRAQQYRSGAWDYTDAKIGRYDTSVTGWQVMALKSAHAAGVKIPPYALYKVMAFFDKVTSSGGQVIYSNLPPSAGRRGQGMAAVGMASGQFLGLPSHSRVVKHQTAIMLSHLPNWSKLAAGRDKVTLDSIYYWYYATIAMFQAGGKPWRTWNKHLQNALLPQQRRGGCLDGSWDPPNNFWAAVGGRLYSTTLNILNLQIYYRYLPIHSGGALPTVDALMHVAQGKQRAHAVQAVRLLGKFEDRKAHNYLIVLAHGDDHGLALEASVALTERRHQDAIAPLMRQLRSSDQFVRHRALRAMAPMIGQGLVPIFIESLNDDKSTVSRLAAQILRQYANVSFDFEPEAPAGEREAAVRKWRQWWEERRKGAVTVEPEPIWLVVEVRPQAGMLAFSTGKPADTARGKKYSVYRGDRYIGRISVVQVKGATVLAKTLEQYTSGEFKEGDVVKPSN